MFDFVCHMECEDTVLDQHGALQLFLLINSTLLIHKIVNHVFSRSLLPPASRMTFLLRACFQLILLLVSTIPLLWEGFKQRSLPTPPDGFCSRNETNLNHCLHNLTIEKEIVDKQALQNMSHVQDSGRSRQQTSAFDTTFIARSPSPDQRLPSQYCTSSSTFIFITNTE